MEDLEFNAAPREHLATWDRLKSMMVWSGALIIITLALMAFFLV